MLECIRTRARGRGADHEVGSLDRRHRRADDLRRGVEAAAAKGRCPPEDAERPVPHGRPLVRQAQRLNGRVARLRPDAASEAAAHEEDLLRSRGRVRVRVRARVRVRVGVGVWG